MVWLEHILGGSHAQPTFSDSKVFKPREIAPGDSVPAVYVQMLYSSVAI